MVNAYESTSSRRIKNEFAQIIKSLVNNKVTLERIFWSRSYCLLTAGGDIIDVVINI